MLTNLIFALWRARLTRFTIAFAFGITAAFSFALLPQPLVAQTTINQAQITEILDGSQVYIQENQAQINDIARRGQRVRTGNARAQLSFNTGAVARLSTNSVLIVGQCARLQSGTLLVNGAVNGCTASVVAGVRGTTYVMQVDEQGREQFKVLEGEITLSRRDPADSADASVKTNAQQFTQAQRLADLEPIVHFNASTRPDASFEPTVVLTAGQKITTQRGARFSSVEPLTVADFIELLNGQLFSGFTEQLPGINEIRRAFEQLFPSIPFPRLPAQPFQIRLRLPF
jgi:hypothetical protein